MTLSPCFSYALRGWTVEAGVAKEAGSTPFRRLSRPPEAEPRPGNNPPPPPPNESSRLIDGWETGKEVGAG